MKKRDKNLENGGTSDRKKKRKIERNPNARVSPTNHKLLSIFNIPERTSKIHLMKTHILPYSI